MRRPLLISSLLLASSITLAEETQTIPVAALAAAPSIDGDLGEWSNDGWSTVPVKPAVDDDDENRTGELEVQLKAAVVGDRIYFAARWPDADASTDYRPWNWMGKKYTRSKKRDDMFAVRFHLDGDYNRCMIAETTYRVDVWLWSAGRSNESGYAEDMWQLITIDPLENAAEYKGPTEKTVYIRKKRDEGSEIYTNNKISRKENQGKTLPSFILTPDPTGSSADVRAKGVWQDGYWNLEISRPLSTGNDDDVVLAPGVQITGAIAVFNQGWSEHKSVSGSLLFDLSGVK